MEAEMIYLIIYLVNLVKGDTSETDQGCGCMGCSGCTGCKGVAEQCSLDCSADDWSLSAQNIWASVFALVSGPRRNLGLDFAECDWWHLTFGLEALRSNMYNMFSSCSEGDAWRAQTLVFHTPLLTGKVSCSYKRAYMFLLCAHSPQQCSTCSPSWPEVLCVIPFEADPSSVVLKCSSPIP